MIKLLITFALFLQCSAAETWTRAKDGKKVIADFVEYNEVKNEVSLKMKNGRVFKFKASTLTTADQEKIKKLNSEETTKEGPEKEEEKGESRHETVTVPGVEHPIQICYPPGYDTAGDKNKDRPLLVIFEAHNNTKFPISRMTKIYEEMGWLIVGIDSFGNVRWSKEEDKIERDTKKVAKFIEKELVYNHDKVVLGGFSGGGYWSYLTSVSTYKKAAGILAIGTTMNSRFNLKYPKKMAVAMINGDKDTRPKKEEQAAKEFLEKKCKASVKVFPYPAAHIFPPSAKVIEAAKWISKTKGF